MAGPTSLRRRGTRLVPYVVSAVVLASVLLPIGWSPPQDDFPLSSYPMFSHPRDRESRVATVVGIEEGGERIILDPWLIGGTDEVILASATAWRAVSGGPEAARRLCSEVAGRLASRPDRVGEAPVRVEVVVERFDTVAYFRDEDAEEPLTRRVFAACRVPAGET